MKSWESPRRGRRRNDKSKAATARLRQLKKRNQQLRKRLRKDDTKQPPSRPSIPEGGCFFHGGWQYRPVLNVVYSHPNWVERKMIWKGRPQLGATFPNHLGLL